MALVNVDDPRGRLLLEAASVPTRPFGLADAEDLRVTPTGSTFVWRGHDVELSLGGDFNVANALAAAEVAVELGVEARTVAHGLSAAGPVPGRFEPVDRGQPFSVIVDYAHTPDGLEQALGAARRLVGAGRVLVVFGAGGERDRDKRPLMGEVASRLADVICLTSDNPRSEAPEAIIDDILSGVSPGARPMVEPDRRRAIAACLADARPGDLVLIAGKGHETTQTVGDDVRPFDDRAVVAELLEGGSVDSCR
ncbi:MAG: cyanophycin synthetase [Acidimicrobiia bacterium]|nr:cyanophycin synthetase [Acidimicrobiia bacterium]